MTVLATSSILDRVYDESLVLKAAGAAVTSGAGYTIIPVGEGLTVADVVVDITALDVASTDEVYVFYMQGSTTSDFSSVIIPLWGGLIVGAAASLGPGVTIGVGTGRKVFTFSNVAATTISTPATNTCMPYVRLAVHILGTSPSITFSAFMSKHQ